MWRGLSVPLEVVLLRKVGAVQEGCSSTRGVITLQPNGFLLVL